MVNINYKKVAVMFLAVVIVALAIIFFQKSISVLPRKPIPAQSTEQTAAGIIKSGKLEDCMQMKGKIVNGVDYETVCRNNIALDFAMKNMDASYCDKLDNKLLKIDRCKEQVLSKKIAADGDISVCDTAATADSKRNCRIAYWVRQASVKKDTTLCKNLADDKEKSYCKDAVLLNSIVQDPLAANCSNLSEGLKQDCDVFKQAIKSGNTNLCRQILNPILQMSCTRPFPAKTNKTK